MVFMLEQTGQRLHAGLQRRVLRLHLAAEAGHHGHGRVQRVFVDQVAAVSDEAQHTVEAAGFKHRPRLPRADQLQHLQAALNQSSGSRIQALTAQPSPDGDLEQRTTLS